MPLTQSPQSPAHRKSPNICGEEQTSKRMDARMAENMTVAFVGEAAGRGQSNVSATQGPQEWGVGGMRGAHEDRPSLVSRGGQARWDMVPRPEHDTPLHKPHPLLGYARSHPCPRPHHTTTHTAWAGDRGGRAGTVGAQDPLSWPGGWGAWLHPDFDPPQTTLCTPPGIPDTTPFL